MEVKSKIYTVYSDEGDMTFIMKDTGDTLECVGFYFGEPDDEMTAFYTGNLVAKYDN